MDTTRIARTGGARTRQEIEAYLPNNYATIVVESYPGEERRGEAVEDYDGKLVTVQIVGTDVAGWTLDDYVIPRLASGLIFAEEITLAPVDRDDMARAATALDIQAEAEGMEATVRKHGVDPDGLTYVAEQRALRACLVMEGRLGELNPDEPTSVALGRTARDHAVIAATWMDGFMAGRVAVHDASADIPGIEVSS